jgi:hypothetical protein
MAVLKGIGTVKVYHIVSITLVVKKEMQITKTLGEKSIVKPSEREMVEKGQLRLKSEIKLILFL